MTVKEKIEAILKNKILRGKHLIDQKQGTLRIQEVENDPKGLIITAEDQKFLIQVSTL